MINRQALGMGMREVISHQENAQKCTTLHQDNDFFLSSMTSLGMWGEGEGMGASERAC
jgi:hypothetical protein